MQETLLKHLKALVKPYQPDKSGWGLDRDDDYRHRGMLDAVEAVANALHEIDPSFNKIKFMKACGNTYTAEWGQINTPKVK